MPDVLNKSLAKREKGCREKKKKVEEASFVVHPKKKKREDNVRESERERPWAKSEISREKIGFDHK